MVCCAKRLHRVGNLLLDITLTYIHLAERIGRLALLAVCLVETVFLLQVTGNRLAPVIVVSAIQALAVLIHTDLANKKKICCEYFAKRNKFHIFATTVSTTLPIDQRTRVELLLFIWV